MAIEWETQDGVAVITINRPEVLNALDRDAYRELSERWIEVRDNERIRAAVITGAGERAFCVGADLKSFKEVGRSLREFWNTQNELLLNRGVELWKPVIAAVNGLCLGGGMTLLLGTDMRVACPEAAFGMPEVRRGVLPGNGGTQRILEQLPHAIAMEMLLTGKRLDAEMAERWGLINRVVERPELLSSAMELAFECSQGAPLAVQAAKEAALRSREMGRNTGLRFEQTMNQLLRTSLDAQEGPRAFAEKRTPHFRGE